MNEMKIKLLKTKLDNTINFIQPFLPLANCHMVEFITSNFWETFIPEGIRNEVQNFGTKESLEVYDSTRQNLLKNDNFENITSEYCHIERRDKFKNLTNFIIESNSHSLRIDGTLCLSVDQLKQRLKNIGASNVDSLKIDQFMSNKKSHEVEILSSMVAMLAASTKVNYTIELGGGRGFLATMLNMLYHMPVLNIDCAESNAKGAEKRNKNMKKKWPSIVKNAENKKLVDVGGKKGKLNLEDDFTKTTEDLLNRVANISVENGSENKTNHLYRHVTEFVTLETDLLKHVAKEFPDLPPQVNLCLTGLHTCGDLGSTTVKLFNKSSECSILCAVPCCYHLLTEKLAENQLTEEYEHINLQNAGFPMSNHLKDFSLGRNARMLASQSVERFAAVQQMPTISLFYRALLQVLLKKYDGNTIPEGKMKGVAEKCSNFSDYYKFAVKKLKLDPSKLNLTDKELIEFEISHGYHKDKLNLFYLLKMCLAPVVESIVLQDRLLYLAENGFDGELGDAYLVKMFDPIVSPRCHALVAFRKKYYEK